MARGVRFLLGFRQCPFLKKTGPGIPVFGCCPFFFVQHYVGPKHVTVEGVSIRVRYRIESFDISNY